MLHESQEEIKELRSRSSPAAHLYFSQSCGVFSGVRNWKRCYMLKETCLRLDGSESKTISNDVAHLRRDYMVCPC